MMTLSDYGLAELFAMQDLMDRIQELLDEYVTMDFKRCTGLQDLADEIEIALHKRVKEDEENAEK